MERTQGNSLCSHLYLKLAKMPCFSFSLLYFFFYKIKEQEGRTGCAQGSGRVGGVGKMGGKVGRERGRRMNIAPIMCAHICKCRNDTC
jgi:hypothetical protein